MKTWKKLFSLFCATVMMCSLLAGDVYKRQPYFIAPPKTKSGIRSIPMTDAVYMAFRRVIENRGSPKVEMMVDGYSGFLFLDKDDRPKVAMHLENYMRLMQRKYVKLYGNTLPTVSPHVLRHTFCTNAQQAMLDVKMCIRDRCQPVPR